MCQAFGIPAARVPPLQAAFAGLNAAEWGKGSIVGNIDSVALNAAFSHLAAGFPDYCALFTEYLAMLMNEKPSEAAMRANFTAALNGAHTQRRYLVSAIHLGAHWALLLVDNHLRTIYIRDSLGAAAAQGALHTRAAVSINAWLRAERGAAFGATNYEVDRAHGLGNLALPLQHEGVGPDAIACGAYVFGYALWHAQHGGSLPTRVNFSGAAPRRALRLVLLDVCLRGRVRNGVGAGAGAGADAGAGAGAGEGAPGAPDDEVIFLQDDEVVVLDVAADIVKGGRTRGAVGQLAVYRKSMASTIAPRLRPEPTDGKPSPPKAQWKRAAAAGNGGAAATREKRTRK